MKTISIFFVASFVFACGGAVNDTPDAQNDSGTQPDASPDPLQQPRTGLGLEPGQVMADRRLRVVQFLGGGRDRSAAGHGVQDAQPGDVEHSSTVSINHRRIWH